MNLELLKDSLPELEALQVRKADAALLLKAGIDAASVRCGVDKKVLAQIVSARVADRIGSLRESSNELSDLIDALEG